MIEMIAIVVVLALVCIAIPAVPFATVLLFYWRGLITRQELTQAWQALVDRRVMP